jgi:pyruvate/2-oxoglutarate dehydrogenase complex dihydrolipoamide dehydrogenase (E3) component
MITAIVAAIAITQREARREKEAKEAEEAEARKKSIVVVGAGLAGLFAAHLCRAQGFTVTVVEAKQEAELLDCDDGIVWLAPNALRVLQRVDEKIAGELKAAACHIEVCVPFPNEGTG